MSLFQSHPPNRRTLPLSLGIETAIIENLRAQETLTDEGFYQAVEQGFCLAHAQDDVRTHLDDLVQRVLTRLDTAKPEPTKIAFQTGKSLGTQYAAWLSDLNSERLCLYLADYDYERAYALYWYTDVEAVQEIATTRGHHDSQRALLNMEACLYGFGGKYEDDNGGGGPAIDHDINDEEAAAVLRSFGF
jgi:hypothetical protein